MLEDMLRKAIAKKGLSQYALARALGVSQPNVSRWLAGDQVPRNELIPDLAAELDIDLDALAGAVNEAVAGRGPTSTERIEALEKKLSRIERNVREIRKAVRDAQLHVQGER